MRVSLAFLAVLLLPGSPPDGVRYYPASRETVDARVERYAGNNKQREQTLKQLFREAGCDDQHLVEQPVRGSKLPNVICTLPGDSARVILVGAHYDRVSAGDGVIDNWSGASLLPSLYQAVKGDARTHSYVFIGFADEEKGIVGSSFYVRQMTREQAAATEAMVNLDTLGLAPAAMWASHADKRLAAALASVAHQMKMPLTGINVERVGSTDSESFAARSIPSITVHSLTQEALNAGILHSSKDKRSALKGDDYYQTYRLVAAYIAYLDRFLSAPAEKPR